MNKGEFSNYIESDLNKEKFEEIALNQIRAEYTEHGSGKKELTETQERKIIKQMWENMISVTYQKMKDQVKSNNLEEWLVKIEELNLIEEINNSFQEY